MSTTVYVRAGDNSLFSSVTSKGKYKLQWSIYSQLFPGSDNYQMLKVFFKICFLN